MYRHIINLMFKKVNSFNIHLKRKIKKKKRKQKTINKLNKTKKLNLEWKPES